MAIKRRDFLKLSATASGVALASTGSVLASPDKTAADTHDDDWGMLNDEHACTGCKTCQFVCKQRAGFTSAGDSPYWDNPVNLNAKNYTIVKLYKETDDYYSYVKRNCMHCNDPACVSACPVQALIKRDDGPVLYDPDRCIGCRYCMIACPFDVPKFEYSKALPEIQKCDLCWDHLVDTSVPEEERKTACSEVCPRNAIITGKRKDLIKEAYRRINEQPDVYQNHVYGEHEVGGTAVVYIASVPFVKLGMPEYDATAIPTLPESIQHGIFKYFVTPIALFGMLAVTRGSQLRCETGDESCIEE